MSRCSPLCIYLLATSSSLAASTTDSKPCRNLPQPYVVQVIAAEPSSPLAPLSFAHGFFINSKVLVAPLHAVQGATKVFVRNNEGASAAVSQVFRELPSNDLILLGCDDLVQDAATQPLKTAIASAVLGEPVEILRLSRGEGISRTKAQVTSCFGSVLDGPRLELNTALGHGASGAPVINREGKIIGMVVQTVDQRESLAVPIASLALDDDRQEHSMTWSAWIDDQHSRWGDAPRVVRNARAAMELDNAAAVVETLAACRSCITFPPACRLLFESCSKGAPEGVMEAIEAAPDDALSPFAKQFMQAVLLERDGRLDAAQAAAERSVTFKEGGQSLMCLSGILLRIGKQERALECARQGAKLAPDDVTVNLYACSLEILFGDHKKGKDNALRLYKALRNSDSATILVRAVMSYGDSRAPGEEEVALEYDACCDVGERLWYDGKSDEARKVAMLATRLRYDESRAKQLLVKALDALGEWKDAVKLVEEAPANGNESGEMLFIYGRVCTMVGRTEKAESIRERLRTIDAEWGDRLGMVISSTVRDRGGNH